MNETYSLLGGERLGKRIKEGRGVDDADGEQF